MKDLPSLPKDISLNDLWKFAGQFDGDGDGTIDSQEYSEFIKQLQPPEQPRHTHFTCCFPDTFTLAEGQLTNWWSPGPGNTFAARALAEKPWEGVSQVMYNNWKQLPPLAQHSKRGAVTNFAVQWHLENGDFRATVLSYSEFVALSHQPSANLKTTVAIQAFVWSQVVCCFFLSLSLLLSLAHSLALSLALSRDLSLALSLSLSLSHSLTLSLSRSLTLSLSRSLALSLSRLLARARSLYPFVCLASVYRVGMWVYTSIYNTQSIHEFIHTNTNTYAHTYTYARIHTLA